MSSNYKTEQYGYRYELENTQQLARITSPFSVMSGLDFSQLPEEVDPRSWLRIENQGSMGSCQGHAQSTCGEVAYYIASGGEVIQFSPLFAYYATQKLDGLQGADRGSTISGGARVGMELGFCPLEVMPYPNPVKYNWQLPQKALDAAKDFKIAQAIDIDSYDSMIKFLGAGLGAVEIGILWSDRYMTPNSDGCIEDYAESGGGHAVTLAGYSKRRARDGRKYGILVNSWDLRWGVKGTAEVSPNALDKMFRGQWTVARGLTDMVSPKIRKIPRYGFLD